MMRGDAGVFGGKGGTLRRGGGFLVGMSWCVGWDKALE